MPVRSLQGRRTTYCLFTSFVDTDYSPEVLSVHAVPVPEPSVLFALFTQMVTTSGYGASFFAIFHFTILSN